MSTADNILPEVSNTLVADELIVKPVIPKSTRRISISAVKQLYYIMGQLKRSIADQGKY